MGSVGALRPVCPNPQVRVVGAVQNEWPLPAALIQRLMRSCAVCVQEPDAGRILQDYARQYDR